MTASSQPQEEQDNKKGQSIMPSSEVGGGRADRNAREKISKSVVCSLQPHLSALPFHLQQQQQASSNSTRLLHVHFSLLHRTYVLTSLVFLYCRWTSQSTNKAPSQSQLSLSGPRSKLVSSTKGLEVYALMV